MDFNSIEYVYRILPYDLPYFGRHSQIRIVVQVGKNELVNGRKEWEIDRKSSIANNNSVKSAHRLFMVRIKSTIRKKD